MNESFPATMKLVTGEEVLCEISPTEENGQEFFLVSNPIVVNEQLNLDHQKGVAVSGLIPKKWMMYSGDDLTIVYKQHVISISEMDKFGADFYKKALIAAKVSSPIKRRVSSEENVGFVGKVEQSREALEKMYDMSLDVPEEDVK
jgi:hypothetical protein